LNKDMCAQRVKCDFDLIVDADSQRPGSLDRDHQCIRNRSREFRRGISPAVHLYGHHISRRDWYGSFPFEHFMLNGAARYRVVVRIMPLDV
jgi:hypothetical protein